MHFRFLTSTPLTVVQGSETYNGIATMMEFLRRSGATVHLITPSLKFPIYTVERLIFNEMLRFGRQPLDTVTVGFDMDGYALAGRRPGFQVAAIKGVIADEMRFETGLTRATMGVQARCEKLHVQRADMVIAPSAYAAEQIRTYYRPAAKPLVSPEPIDLAAWRSLLQRNPKQPDGRKFTVLSVCRFYPRKRLGVLLEAAEHLRLTIPELEVRIVGDGPEASRLKSIYRTRGLEKIVTWLGNLSQADLAREYNRCDIFCLPTLQESFGIVFLEAMASAKPIVACRAACVPEVVKHGVLVEPDDAEALAEGIRSLYADSALRATLAAKALDWVSQFDAPRVAALFLRAVESASRTR